MSARITQRAQEDQQRWAVSVQLRRGTTNVGDPVVLYMPVRDSIGQIAWSFIVPGTAPTTGDWTFQCPLLSELATQDIGVCLAGGVLGWATLTTGVISTNAPLAAGTRTTLRGMIEV